MTGATHQTLTANDELQTIPRGKLGIWWFLASEVMVFGGLLGSFVLVRLASGGWAEEAAHVSTRIAAINTLILLTSSLTIVQAHEAVDNDDRDGVTRYLLATVLLGVLFLAMKAYEYSIELSHGFTPASGGFWSYYYILTGLHGLHVLAGIIANLALLVLSVRGRLWPNTQQRVEYAGLYWHFVDVVWIFLFPLVYLS